MENKKIKVFLNGNLFCEGIIIGDSIGLPGITEKPSVIPPVIKPWSCSGSFELSTGQYLGIKQLFTEIN